jgi:hypothetical protein
MKKLTAEELTAVRYAIVRSILKTDPAVASRVKDLLVSASLQEARGAAREAKVPAEALAVWYVR